VAEGHLTDPENVARINQKIAGHTRSRAVEASSHISLGFVRRERYPGPATSIRKPQDSYYYPKIAKKRGRGLKSCRTAPRILADYRYRPAAWFRGGATVERRTALPLQRRQIFATQDAEEARVFLGARGFLLDIPPCEATDLDMQLKSVFLPGLLFTRLKYGAAVQIRTTENYEDYRFVAPLRGRLVEPLPMRTFPAGLTPQCWSRRRSIVCCGLSGIPLG
jgi:hypothetical protein